MSPLHRRLFLRRTGITIAGLAGLPAWARRLRLPTGAPVLPPEYPLHNIPADKNLSPAWIKSLYERGRPTTYRKSKNELTYIGMPAGGLHSGTLYMGGDGRLWLWGIYNDDREGADPHEALWNDGTTERKILSRDGAAYVEPSIADNKRVLEQGFALRIEQAGTTVIKQLREEDWDEVVFEATYPHATVTYTAKDCPVEVVLTAGSFFTPLNPDDSALPATFFTVTVRNRSSRPVDLSLAGWLENGVGKVSARAGDGVRINTALDQDGGTHLLYTFPALRDRPDAGTMCFALLGRKGRVHTDATDFFSAPNPGPSQREAPGRLIGCLSLKETLAPGATLSADYALSWHFNHPLSELGKKMPESKAGYYYATRFPDAGGIMQYIARHWTSLHRQTLLWQETFYDSTLPHWFLERTLVNVGTIATANTYRFADGRFWGWEGINSCEGTCTHVWQYGHALARLFPSLERDTRQRVDLGIALMDDGGIRFRGEFQTRAAIDGQAGTILRIYREHQMSPDDVFLKQNWPAIKKAVSFMLAQDKNGDGMTDTPMENTLDAMWDGEVAWIVGLCIAAARAAQAMAEEVGDPVFARTCTDYVAKGSRNMEDQLFNGEYFIHRPDPVSGRKKLGSYNTCHIDQVYGQSWAFQVGLGRILDRDKTVKALHSLWTYNFAPDVGPYIHTHTGGRPYALDGEAGMVMNTNPHNDPQPYGEDVTWQGGYFHECMTGFEHQVAAHMMAEGMTDEALILTRAIHDRYHAAKRNPYNEIECSDHYARAMASYGTFIAACGFSCHGPRQTIRFGPKISPDHFRAPFTTAEGWGTYAQQRTPPSQRMQAQLLVKYGRVTLSEIGLELASERPVSKAEVSLGEQTQTCKLQQDGKALTLFLPAPWTVAEGQTLRIVVA